MLFQIFSILVSESFKATKKRLTPVFQLNYHACLVNEDNVIRYKMQLYVGVHV